MPHTARCDHTFPVQPPHGSIFRPGNCDCGISYEQARAEQHLTATQLDEIAESHPGDWYSGEWRSEYVEATGDDQSEAAYYRIVHPASGTTLATLPDWAGPIALFIADAHTAVPALLADLRRARAQVRFLLGAMARKDARTGEGDRALREFLGCEPGPEAADDRAVQVLSDEGTQCGDCGDQPGDRTCPDCEKHRARYVAALRAAGWAPQTDPIGDTTTETARALLWRHGLPEDIIDGALCLHAQELAAVQRKAVSETDDPVFYDGEAGWLINLIDPTQGDVAPAVLPAVPVAPTTHATDLRDRIADVLAAADGWQWATDRDKARSSAYRGYQSRADAVLAVLPPPADRAAVLREAAKQYDRLLADLAPEIGKDPRYWAGVRHVVIGLRRMADEAQQQADTETQAHPPHHRWMVETHDDLADEWAPGMRFTDRAEAVERYGAVSERFPAWKDGTPVQRRFVRETTTYTVEQPVPGPGRADGEEQAETPDEELLSGTRPCGHDDYHDGHPWHEQPHLWCPGRKEPHPTQADMDHASAVWARFRGQGGTTESGKEA